MPYKIPARIDLSSNAKQKLRLWRRLLSSPDSTSAEITKISAREICLPVLASLQYSLCARRIVVKSRVCTMRVKLPLKSDSVTPTVAAVIRFRSEGTARRTCLKKGTKLIVEYDIHETTLMARRVDALLWRIAMKIATDLSS